MLNIIKKYSIVLISIMLHFIIWLFSFVYRVKRLRNEPFEKAWAEKQELI